MTTNAPTKDGRTVRAFNPLSRNKRMLLRDLHGSPGQETVSSLPQKNQSRRKLRMRNGKTRIAWKQNKDSYRQKAFLIDGPLATGHVIAFAAEPNFRAYFLASGVKGREEWCRTILSLP